MNEAEIKLLIVKCDLQKDILKSNDQIHYEIKAHARKCRDLLQSIKRDENESTLLTIDKYEILLNYLYSIERETIHTLKGSEYISRYYADIETKSTILNKL